MNSKLIVSMLMLLFCLGTTFPGGVLAQSGTPDCPGSGPGSPDDCEPCATAGQACGNTWKDWEVDTGITTGTISGPTVVCIGTDNHIYEISGTKGNRDMDKYDVESKSQANSNGCPCTGGVIKVSTGTQVSDPVTATWSLQNGGSGSSITSADTATKYRGKFKAPTAAGTVTIKATLSDGAAMGANDQPNRDDADKPLTGFAVKVIDVGTVAVSSPAVEIPDPTPLADDPTNTKVYGVMKADTGTVTVTFTATPTVSESDIPSCWKTEGGTGDDNLTRTVPITGAGVHIVTASINGVKKARAKIYVFEISVTAKKHPELPAEFSEGGTTIAVGGLASGIHKAHVKIEVNPAFGDDNEVKIELLGEGAGDYVSYWYWSLPAKASTFSVGGQTLTFGSASSITLTAVDSQTGTLTSSNKLETTTVKYTLVDFGIEKTIDITFGEAAADIQIPVDPPLDESFDVPLTLTVDGLPVDNHNIRAAITAVVLDENSFVEIDEPNKEPVINGLASESLSDYVQIGGGSYQDVVTDSNGAATLSLKIVNGLVVSYTIGIGDVTAIE